MKFSRITAALGGPAYITPQAHRELQDLFAGYVRNGGFVTPPKIEDWRKAYEGDDEEEGDDNEPEVELGPVREVHISGVLMRKPSFFQQLCVGAYSLANGQATMDALAADPECQMILLRIDSPGGSVAGTLEMGAAIRRATETKPVIAIVEGQACSGGYWLASQCDAIVSSPTAILGSIGAYIAWLDDAGWLKKNGYSWEVFRAGEHKAAGLGRDLTKAERKHYQDLVDHAYLEFTAAVKSTRPEVSDETMQGQVFTAEEAMKRGLIDAIEENMPALLTRVRMDPDYLMRTLEGLQEG